MLRVVNQEQVTALQSLLDHIWLFALSEGGVARIVDYHEIHGSFRVVVALYPIILINALQLITDTVLKGRSVGFRGVKAILGP